MQTSTKRQNAPGAAGAQGDENQLTDTSIVAETGQQVKRLFEHLHRGGQYWYYWTLPARLSQWHDVGTFTLPPNGRRDVYFSVHPSAIIPTTNARGEQVNPSRVRSQTGSIAAINCLFAEFDAKDYGDKPATLAHVNTLTPAPSAIIDSGGGYHCYWLLVDPFVLDTEAARERARAIQGAWVDLVGGDKGAKDLARVLRVPGTHNYKEKYAPDFPPVAFVSFDPALTYELDALEALLPEPDPEPARVAAPIPPASTHTTDDGQQALETARRMIRDAQDGEKHAILLKASKLLGGYIAGGMVSEGDAVNTLETAIANKPNVVSFNQAQRTIQDGIEYGRHEPITRVQRELERLEWLQRNNGSTPPPQAPARVDPGTGEIRDDSTPPPQAPARVDPGTGEIRDDSTPPAVDHLTDMGNSSRFARQHVDKLRHVPQWGWLAWDGKRWSRDNTGAHMRAARQTALELYSEAQALETRANALIPALQAAVEAEDSDKAEGILEARNKLQDTAKKVLKWALKSQGRSRLDAMTALASSERPLVALPEWFDTDPWLLNCQNGTLDLRTLELHPHDPGDRITKLAGTSWEPNATCERWKQFLNEIFLGDTELIRFFQRRVGYSLTGVTQEQEFAFLYGHGANGKSTAVSILLELLGDYATTTQSDTLLERKRNAIPNDVAALAGARLVVASELPEKATLNENLVKDLTGCDSITARFLHKEFFTFTPQFKLWLYGNHKPRVRGTDDGIWRRVNLVPFEASFTGQDADPDLVTKLRAELPGILAWAVQGCQAWQSEGLRPAQAVTEASRQYRSEQDALGAFIADCCIVKTTVKAYTSDLYSAYQSWCEDSGEYPVNKRLFGQALRERGFIKTRGNDNRQEYKGIGLLQ